MRKRGLWMIVLLLAAAMFACSSGPSDAESPVEINLETPIKDPKPTESLLEKDQEPTAEAITAPTAAPTNTTPEEPLAVADLDDLIIVNSGFVMDDTLVRYVFLVENPNVNAALENSSYTVQLLDADGIELFSQTMQIFMIYPGQILPVSGFTMFTDGEVPAEMRIELEPGQPLKERYDPAFAVEKPLLLDGEYSSHVTGFVTNLHDREYGNILQIAIIYDAAGNIIGTGESYKTKVLAGQSAGMVIPVNYDGDPERVEIYANLTRLSTLGQVYEAPDDAKEVSVLKLGFGQKRNDIGFGFMLENKNQQYAVLNSAYELMLLDEAGNLVASKEGYVPLLLPGQVLGFGNDMTMLAESTAVSAQLNLTSGEFVPFPQHEYLVVVNPVLQDDGYNQNVAGLLISPYDFDIDGIKLYVLVLDSDGEIIGGGSGSGYSAPANSSIEVSTYIYYNGEPAEVIMFASLPDLDLYTE